MSRQVHLGLDVGGTATRWVACGADGAVLGRGQVCGATGHIFNATEKQRLVDAMTGVAQALASADMVAITATAGMTGYGSTVAPEVKRLIEGTLGVLPTSIALLDDIVLAYVAHFEPGAGHLISSGTGSIGVHVTSAGEIIRVGGRGILVDDAGSGSWIALRALDQIYRLHDHDGDFGRVAQLADRLFEMIGGSAWHDVRQYVYGGDRGRIGQLALAVSRAAEDGDTVALKIIEQAGAELVALGTALSARAGELPICLIGGVLELHPVILETIRIGLKGVAVSRGGADAPMVAARLNTGHRQGWKTILYSWAHSQG